MTDDEKNTARQQEPENAKKPDITPFLKANKKEVQDIQPVRNSDELEKQLEKMVDNTTMLMETAMRGPSILLQAAANAAAVLVAIMAGIGSQIPQEELRRYNAILNNVEAVIQDTETLNNLCPYIDDELKKKEYGGLSLNDFVYDELLDAYNGRITEDDPKSQLLVKAVQAALATMHAATQPGKEKQLPAITKPNYHKIINSKFMNELAAPAAKTGIVNDGPQNIVVRKANEKKHLPEITTYIVVSYDEENAGIKLDGSDRLTEYQRQISDSIFTAVLQKNNNDQIFGISPFEPVVIPFEAIYQGMPGCGGKASAHQQGAITKTLKAFNNIIVEINATDELMQRGIDLQNGLYLTGKARPYLPYKVDTYINRGKTVKCLIVEEPPIALQYAVATKQIITVDRRFLEIKKLDSTKKISTQPVQMSQERQAIIGYLVRRIKIIQRDIDNAKQDLRNYSTRQKKDKTNTLEDKTVKDFLPNKNANIILFDTIFKDVGINGLSRQQEKRYKDFIINEFLEYEKASGLLKDYRIRPGAKKTIDAIELPLSSKGN